MHVRKFYFAGVMDSWYYNFGRWVMRARVRACELVGPGVKKKFPFIPSSYSGTGYHSQAHSVLSRGGELNRPDRQIYKASDM